MTSTTSNGRDYSDAEIATLKREWQAGKSAKQIAAMLPGRSRNAIIGKLNRLGLSDTQRIRNPDVRPGPASRPPTNADWFLRKRIAAKAKAAVPKPASVVIWEAETEATPPKVRGDAIEVPVEQRKQILDLEPGDCRFPYNDPTKPEEFYFCGGPKVPGLSYCLAHAQACYLPSAVKSKPGRPFVFVGHPGTTTTGWPVKSPGSGAGGKNTPGIGEGSGQHETPASDAPSAKIDEVVE